MYTRLYPILHRSTIGRHSMYMIIWNYVGMGRKLQKSPTQYELFGINSSDSPSNLIFGEKFFGITSIFSVKFLSEFKFNVITSFFKYNSRVNFLLALRLTYELILHFIPLFFSFRQ